MSAEIPKTIGRFRIERLLGKGAMGSVYLGVDPELARKVAIKTVRDLDLDPPTLARFLDRFRNEAKAAARLSHPSIVQVYDVGEDEAVGPYLVFEYVAGASLREVIAEQGALSPKRLATFARQIAEAMDLAHDQGVIHRDIKPDNLLVAEDGRVKLADFGIARVPDAALTKEGQFLGTPCYAAPETLRHGAYSARSDVFSFAAVLYEASTGVRAFPGNDAVAVANKVAHEEPLLPSQAAVDVRIPGAVDKVLMRGLAKDPAKRYGSARELSDALVAALASTKLVDADGMPPRTSAAWTKHAGGLTGLALGLGLFAMLGLVLLGRSGATEATVDGGVDGSASPISVPTKSPGTNTQAKRIDAAATPVVVDASAADAANPTPRDLRDEDRAKDLISKAEDLLDKGDFAAAASTLAEAARLDPTNDDIAKLRARLPKDAPAPPTESPPPPATPSAP